MAPRKRATNKNRKNNPRSTKLEAFLNDFDSEVNSVVERLKEKINGLLKDVDNFYSMAMIKLPMAVRQMNWIEYCGSDTQKMPEDVAKKEETAAQVDTVMAEVHTVSTKSAKKAVRKRGGAGPDSEDRENMALDRSCLKKGKSTRKAPSTSKRAKCTSVSKNNTSVRKSGRRPLVTPVRNILDCSLMGPTPLVTPRFDPRLPKTPAVRIPRHKEKVYSISVNGSPLAEGSEDIIINVPMGNGESIQLLASEISTMDLSQLNESARSKIKMLQNRLASLCVR